MTSIGAGSLILVVDSSKSRLVRMNVNDINEYLQRAREIIGDRSSGEIAYDNAIVRGLRRGMDIRRAVRAANREYPEEAIEPRSEDWDDLANRYEYLAEHQAILKKLGIKE